MRRPRPAGDDVTSACGLRAPPRAALREPGERSAGGAWLAAASPLASAQPGLCPPARRLLALCSRRPFPGRPGRAAEQPPCAALASSSSPSPPPARGRALPPMVSRPEPESEAMDAELVVTPPGCSHLSSFKVDNWKQNLRAIYQCFVWSGTAEARKRKVRVPSPPENCGLSWEPGETPLFAALLSKWVVVGRFWALLGCEEKEGRAC